MFDAFVLRFEFQQLSLWFAARASPPTAQSVACVYPCRLKPLKSVTYSRTHRREKPIRTKAVRQSTAYCDRLLLCSAVLRPTALAFLVGFPVSADRSVDASVAFLLCMGPCRCPEQVLGRSIDRSIDRSIHRKTCPDTPPYPTSLFSHLPWLSLPGPAPATSVICAAIEIRELLDRLFSWCDLCLPANEQAFAESHRQKIQKFQVQIVQEMKRSNSARSQVRHSRPEDGIYIWAKRRQ